MGRLRFLFTVVAITGLASLAPAAEPRSEGFKPLFNGKDLTGWVNVNCAPKTFFVKDQKIVTTGSPTGFLRSDKQYENFEMELEWMHIEKTKMANSGVFVWGDPIPAVGSPYTRGIEVQVLINFKPADGWATSHGDIFSIWGAKCKPDRPHPKGIERCLPSEDRVKGAGEWNHYKIIGKDGSIKLHVNGKEVSGVTQCNPRVGYLALESEGVECHFRNIRIKELPGSNPAKTEIANVAAGHVSLFNGLTMEGWTAEKGTWRAGGALRCDTAGELHRTEPVTAGELVFDWKVPAKSTKAECVLEIGGKPMTMTMPPAGKAGSWTRATVSLAKLTEPSKLTFKGTQGLELMNVFHSAATTTVRK